MWISRAEYENLKANIKCLEARYTEQLKITDRILDERKDRSIEISVLRRQIEELEAYKQKQIEEIEVCKQEVEEYKQKYADEVQKRLELVKLLENTP